MPVATVTSAAPTDRQPPAPTTPEPGFAATLARAVDPARLPVDPSRLPTVTLAQMVSARSAGPIALEPPPGALGDLDAPMQVRASTPVGDAAPGPLVASGDGPGAAVLEAGERYLGVPYKWGGTTPSGFDCSGFVQRVFSDLGVSLPRVSVDQSRAGVEVGSLAEAQPGDLVFWHGNAGRPNHIGIYAGDGKMLVAPRTGDVVRYQEITRTPDRIRRVIS